jgi:hypothetical protein
VAVRGIADGAHRPSWRPGRRPLNVRGPPPSAMRPCAPGLSHGRGRKTHGRGNSSGYADRPSGFLPLAWHFRMPARCLRRRVLVCFGGAEGVSDPLVAASAGPSRQWVQIFSRTATPRPARQATSVAGTPEFSHTAPG